MAKAELGTKRVCAECGTKFYDLNKNPMACPNCGTTFDVASLMTARLPAAKMREKPKEAEEPEEVAVEEPLVALEDADAEEAETGRAAPDVADDDVPDLEEDEDLDDEEKDTEFLEDEEDDDDVSTLIEGDIEDEED